MRKITLLSFYVTLLFAAAASAFALDFSHFNHLVVFGDSLSDNGNSFVLFKKPQPPYFEGRWSNGPIWVDYFPSVANHFDSVTPFYANQTSGTNVAVGGSTSADFLHVQIPDYIQAKGTPPRGRISNDDLYCIWAGANDFTNRIAPQQTVANILSGITALARAGAKQIILVNIPAIWLTPYVKALDALEPGTVQAARQFVAAVNVLLAVEAPLIAWQQQINVSFVDVNAFFVPLILNPAFFGFSNSVDAAFVPPDGPIAPYPDSYVFWDGFHPTTKVHRLAAQFIYRVASSSFPFSILSSR